MFSVTLIEETLPETVEYDPPQDEKSPLMKLNTRNLKKLHTVELLCLYGKPYVSGKYARAIELTLCKRRCSVGGRLVGIPFLQYVSMCLLVTKTLQLEYIIIV